MFERLTDKARAAMVISALTAGDAGSHWVEPRHVLIGLATADGDAAQALAESGYVASPAPGRAARDDAKLETPFSPRTKWVLERALQHALDDGANYICSGHVLAAVLDEDGDGVRDLAAQGITANTVREHLRPLLARTLARLADEHPVRQRATPAAATGSDLDFHNFSSTAVEVMNTARREARALGHGYLGVEHIFLGVAMSDAEELRPHRDAAIAPAAARELVVDLVRRGSDHASRDLPFTPHAKEAVERAWRAAVRHHTPVDVRHLVLGLSEPASSLGGRLLVQSGLDVAAVTAAVR